MKKKLFLLATAIGSLALVQNATADTKAPTFNPEAVPHVRINMNLLGQKKDMPVGYIIAADTPYGVAFYPHLSGLKNAEGLHGFHVHMNPSCGAIDGGLGKQAGGHWDPTHSGQHSVPWDNNGHKGDLPSLYINAQGDATHPVLAVKIKNINELKGHALMVHVGGDNYSDVPKKLGGGGARMICGVIK
ncbi:superoxide dismutase family protein [Actinobacillus delphinicola]|uniref:Superoxide dismutase Cu-Zn n=1 Tax=Actinobacillus delphinicola TaxID=51161 RepID=A0A448TRJ2_9PAST|nr:superoxide dismutase family protein [Actinobacillus delphinicola]VEJ08619.1 superoxide dismutase Cu-Zn [Actinobacillus delphinicola]